MYTDYCVLKELHNQLGNDLSIFSYNHFRISWYTFLSLLDIDYDCGFKCTECGDHPTTLIMDATSLAFRKELDSWHNFLQPQPCVDSQRKSGR